MSVTPFGSININNNNYFCAKFLLMVLLLPSITFGADNLLHYNIDPSAITVSGISSGAAMATQLHFAHSRQFKGCGLFAGGPYNCAYGGYLPLAVECVSNPHKINISRLIQDTTMMAEGGLIDPTLYIERSNVYIFHGIIDSVVRQGAGQNAALMYKHFGASVKMEFTFQAEHGQPTHDFGGPCDQLNPTLYFANKCDYMGAFEMLNYLYDGGLIRPSTNESEVITGQLFEFDQAEFFTLHPSNYSMNEEGYIYVPKVCQDGATQCRLHIAFHGCQSNKDFFGDVYATKTGYIPAADLNSIIVLFPQTAAIPENLEGCWDWYGYLGNLMYPTKRGLQMTGVEKMLNRVVHG